MDKAQKVAALMKRMFGGGVEFHCQFVLHSNEEWLAICICVPGKCLLPVVYLEEMPEDGSVEDIARFAAAKYQVMFRGSIQDRLDIPEMSRENILRSVVLQALSRVKNPGIAERYAHFVLLDMLGVFGIPIGDCDEGLVSMMIPQEVIQAVGISQEELRQAAGQNLLKEFGMVVTDVMGLLGVPVGGDGGARHPFRREKTDWPQVYVLANRIAVNGAGLILIPEVLESLGRKMGRDFFIVPSSIHSVTLVPDDGNFNVRKAKYNICLANWNSRTVDPKDVLTDSLYRYSRAQKTLSIV